MCGIEGIVLEDHGDVPVLGRKVIDHFIIDIDVAGGDVLQAGHHAQSRGLAAAAGPDQDHELLVRDLQIKVYHRLDFTEVLVQFFHDHFCHRSHSFKAPVMPAT